MARTRRANKRFWPPKYYAGLTLKQKIQRKKEIQRVGPFPPNIELQAIVEIQ